MADARKTDSAMHPLLARGLRSSLDATGKDCPEPEILAAYFDRELGSEETKHWELHFSACARCQEQLAVLARTADIAPAAAPAPAIPWFARFAQWRWVVPVATAAVVVAVYLAVRPTLRVQEVATIPQELPTVSAPAKPAAPPAEAKAPLSEDDVAKAKSVEAAPQSPVANLAAGRVATDKLERVGAAAQPPRKVEIQPVEERPQIAVAREAEQIRQVPAAVQQAKAERSVVAGAAAPESREQRAEAVAIQKDEAVAVEKKQQALAESAPKSGPVTRATAAFRAEALLTFAPASGKVVWRYAPGGPLERSSDDGKTWATTLKNLEHPLAAGSCVSEKVCWAVGAAGYVLRTTDGEHWERVASPAASSLTAVVALDGLKATVTSADGKLYSTADGGRTWKLH